MAKQESRIRGSTAGIRDQFNFAESRKFWAWSQTSELAREIVDSVVMQFGNATDEVGGLFILHLRIIRPDHPRAPRAGGFASGFRRLIMNDPPTSSVGF